MHEVKVIPRSLGQGEGHLMKMLFWIPGHQFNLPEVKVINEGKVTHQVQL